MRHIGKRAATVAVLGAATTLVCATAAAADEPVTAYADVDGDGVADTVTVRQLTSDAQSLTFEFAGQAVTTTFPADAGPPMLQPRPADINGDGKDEVIVAHSVGANTLTFTIWKYEPTQGIVALTTSAGGQFDLYEGGGIAAVDGYGCEPSDGGRRLVTVGAYAVGAGTPTVYDGDRTTFSVNRNAVTVESRTPIHNATRDNPLLATDPATCAP